jgi:hypothetical protein
MRRVKKGKTKAVLNSHARRRALERHGVVLSKALRHAILNDIKEMPAGGSTLVKFVSRYSDNRSLWEVTLPERTFRIIFDRKRSAFVTVLPAGAER